MRYYLGVDWADEIHQIWVGNEVGEEVREMEVKQTVEAMAELGRWLDEKRAEGTELWAAIEKPEGRIVDFLLDHGVVVHPVNPKVLDRARDRYRQSRSKSDRFDAFVLAQLLRTDHLYLRPLVPSSEAAQELKMLTRDHERLTRQQTRLLNQLTVTLKEYYPRPLEVFSDFTSQLAVDFLQAYPTPQALLGLKRKHWERFCKEHGLSHQRVAELWEALSRPQHRVPEHVVRAKARLLTALLQQLIPVLQAVEEYSGEIIRFFASMPAAKLVETLPSKGGVIVPKIFAEMGDAPGRWESFRHLQAEAGQVPVTQQSGKSRVVKFRFACNKHLRYALYWMAFNSLRQSEWAKAYYQRQRARGHSQHRALRALGAKWLKILFVMWRDHVPYDENRHLANIARQHLRQAA